MFCQVLPRPVPGADPDGLLRHGLRGDAEVPGARLGGLEAGEAAEAEVRSAHVERLGQLGEDPM